MEPVPGAYSAPAPAPRSTHFDHLTVIAFGVIILAGVITIIGFGISSFFAKSATNATVYAALGPLPASPLSVLDAKNGTSAPLMIMVDGKELAAVNLAPGPDGSWYYLLIERSDDIASNLYQRAADGTITKLTNTISLKYNLTESPNGLLSYQEATIAKIIDLESPASDWSVMVYDPNTTKARVVGEGVAPVFVSNETLLFRNKDGLVALRLNEIDGAPHKILNLGSTMVYTISSTEKKAALFNEITQRVDTYELSYEGLAVSYLSSIDLGGRPSAMTYSNDTLFASVPTKVTATQTSVSLIRVESAKVLDRDVIYTLNSIPQRLYAYE